MNVVVISYVCMVVVLQSHHEGDKCAHWDLKGFQKISLLEEWAESVRRNLISIYFSSRAMVKMLPKVCLQP